MTRRLAMLCMMATAFARGQSGTGLTGQYYDDATFATLKTTRVDSAVDFGFGTGIPSGTAITNADTFSVAWSGQVEPRFSELYTFHVTADDGARLWIDDQMVVARTFFRAPGEMRGQVKLVAGQKVNLRLEFIEQTGNASIRLEWSSASQVREVVPAARLYPVRADRAGGSILLEHWDGLAGTGLAALTTDSAFPSKPDGREFPSNFECLARDWADHYGTRVTGFLVPPVTGDYFLAVSGDDVVELSLSPDASSANKALVAKVADATGFREWTAQPAQQSGPHPLVQGQRYYVELLHKEEAGADHFSVGWRKPGDTSFNVIPGSALVQAGLDRTQPGQAALLDTMAQAHPRLFATAQSFAALRARWLDGAASQPKTWAQAAITSANTILGQTPVTYSPDVRGTILGESRTVKDRMYALGVAWWMTGDTRYPERAWTELEAVAAFPDWHPAHFLDTAEMSHAFGLGYDWFYAYWSPERRDTIRTALVNLGLNAGLGQYTSNASWTRSTGNNWNCVCNGGLALGALALGSENETLSEDILNRALNSVRPVLRHFTTDDGNWYEGPGYWGYTIEYAVRLLAGLEWALGSDFGLSATRNLGEAGWAPILANGPTNVIFNYADAGAGGPPRGPPFLWFARRFNQPVFAWWENQSSSSPLGALWWVGGPSGPSNGAQPTDMAFHGEAGTSFQPQEMVTLRGRWGDTRATFVGVKGGEMGAAHGNLDAGTFVLDALGKRWFHDLGGDNYALPGYFSSTPSTGTDRWDYYRMRAEGQNTLVIDPGAGGGMTLGAVAPLLAYESEPGGVDSLAIHDLTPAYSGVTRVWRGTKLLGARSQVLVQDEIAATAGRTVWWFAHLKSSTTTVAIEPDGTAAMLTQGSERLWCRIVSGAGTFQLMDALPLPASPNPAGQNANAGIKKLAIQLQGVTNTTLAVWFVPLGPGESPPAAPPALQPLAQWDLATQSNPPVVAGGLAYTSGDGPVDIDLRAYVTDDATPPEQMRFTVSAPVNGTIVLLEDGHTARFTPAPETTGLAGFSFTATDTTPDPRTFLAYDFDGPDPSEPLTVPDVGGQGNHGTLHVLGSGAATLVTGGPPATGRDGRMLDLVENGGAHAARLTRAINAAELDFSTSDWTITGWFQRRDPTNEDMLWHLGAGDGYGSNNELYLWTRGGDAFELQHWPGPDASMAGPPVLPGSWHHFAVVRSGSRLDLYLDGTLAGSDAASALALDQSLPLVFGGHASTSATYVPRWMDGCLDELAVFRGALEPAEIATLAGGLTVRHFGGLSSTAALTIASSPSSYVWTNASTGAGQPWSEAANWAGNTVPPSARGTEVSFFGGQALGGGPITSSNDLAAGFRMNKLTFAGNAATATTVAVTGNPVTLLDNGTAHPVVSLAAPAGGGLVYNIAWPMTLAADTTFSGSQNGTFEFSGALGGAGGLTRTETQAKLILSGPNNYAGPTVIAAGTLQIGNDGPTGTLGLGPVTNHGTLRFDRTGTLAVPNPIGGTGSLTVDGPINSGTVILTGNNTFTGAVTVNSGALRIDRAAALGTGSKTIRLSNGTAGNPQLQLDGSGGPIVLPSTVRFETSNASSGAVINLAGDNTLAGDFTLTSGGGATYLVSNGGSLTLAGNLAPNTTSRALRLGGTASGTITGTISDGSTTNVLTEVKKEGPGTWTLAGPVTHTGKVTVGEGTLWVSGDVRSASSVTVSAGATLAGGGTIQSPTTIQGTHSPGEGIGNQTLGSSLAYAATGRLRWELAANSTTAGDHVAAASASLAAGSAVNLVFTDPGSAVDFADPFWAAPRSWTILEAATITGSIQVGSTTTDIHGRPASGYGTFSTTQTGTAVNILWTPRPPVEQWRFTWFSTNTGSGNASDAADPDHDGYPNLVEYATGLDPTRPSGTPLTTERSAGGFSLTYPISLRATDVAVVVEWTDTLAAGVWQTSDVAFAIVSEDDLTRRIRATVTASGLPRCFVRLRINRP